ncbi:MAG: protein kinase, partial [Clostridia bacterium]|nr:protein kinase [Clostridia bacterium]
MTYCSYCMSPIKTTYKVCPFCGNPVHAEVPAHHLLPGTILNGKILVGAALGEGGFGITYIGRDLNLDIKVAIKEFYPNGYVNRSNSFSPDVTFSVSDDGKDFFVKGKERFLREARILARFSSEPGVVEVRDFFEEHNTAYIIMEYLDGEDLKAYLKRNGPMQPGRALELLLPVMKTLTKIHAQGLIHRDISPDN